MYGAYRNRVDLFTISSFLNQTFCFVELKRLLELGVVMHICRDKARCAANPIFFSNNAFITCLFFFWNVKTHRRRYIQGRLLRLLFSALCICIKVWKPRLHETEYAIWLRVLCLFSTRNKIDSTLYLYISLSYP